MNRPFDINDKIQFKAGSDKTVYSVLGYETCEWGKDLHCKRKLCSEKIKTNTRLICPYDGADKLLVELVQKVPLIGPFNINDKIRYKKDMNYGNKVLTVLGYEKCNVDIKAECKAKRNCEHKIITEDGLLCQYNSNGHMFELVCSANSKKRKHINLRCWEDICQE